MTIRFVDIELAVRTATNDARFRTEFNEHLNVIEAPNTWGKSTLMQSFVFGLGLEGSISASHLSPLGEAMTSVIDLDGQREAVLESTVTLTLVNDAGQYIRTRRYARSLQYEMALIQTWSADTLDGLTSAPQEDFFVRLQGAASHEAGFHLMLERFIGWELPLVPGFNADEVKLYLEVLFPLFYIEQKYGWAGLAPRIPTHYRIRSAYRRAAEFVLGLGALERLKQIEQLRGALSIAQEAWKVESQDIEILISARGWRFPSDVDSLIQTETDRSATLQVRADGHWVGLEDEVSRWRSALEVLEEQPVSQAGPRTDAARAELSTAERALTLQAAHLRTEKELLSVLETEVATLTARRGDLERERQQLKDVKTLERLGSELHLTSLLHAHCPVCAQSLDAAQVATGIVMDVAANLTLLDAERVTLGSLIDDTQSRVLVSKSTVEAIGADVAARRRVVRSLKDELAGPSNAPSVSQLTQLLQLRVRVQGAIDGVAEVQSLLDSLGEKAERIARLREQLSALVRQEADSTDRGIVRSFRQAFGDALTRFGLRSLPIDEVTIGEESLLPEHDGFELTFDIRHGMSASDSIRTKWAFYVGLANAASTTASAHYLGALLIDEPRQQEAELSSVRALYQALAATATHTQVIVASSAASTELDSLLEGLAVHRIRAHGARMLSNSLT